LAGWTVETVLRAGESGGGIYKCQRRSQGPDSSDAPIGKTWTERLKLWNLFSLEAYLHMLGSMEIYERHQADTSLVPRRSTKAGVSLRASRTALLRRSQRPPDEDAGSADIRHNGGNAL
jgi:hypothetical protein